MSRHADPTRRSIPPRTLVALIVLLSLAVAPHVWHLSPWLTGFYFLLAGLRMLSVRQTAALPGRFLLLLLTIGGALNVFIHQTSPIGKDTAIGLLTVVLGLKLMELKTQRDLYIIVLLGLFLIITQFVYDQGMGLAAYLGVVVIGFTMVLVETNHATAPADPLYSWRKALVLLAQAMPIMLVMFLLFPRLSGPLWNLGLDERAGITGLSDTISPGSVSRLSRSRAVAFRVDFEGDAPPPEKRYWRGPVLWNTDGWNWTTAEFTDLRPARYQPLGKAVSYEVMLEPSRQKWLFALDLPVDLPPHAQVLPDYQILADEPIRRRLRYRQRSYPDYVTGELHPEERWLGLRLPDNITPRMRELVTGWRGQGGSDAAVVTAALRHFNQEEFIYTLSPPLLGNNPADQFLFETRRGFCEHFATSFTLLMRTAGIPARVVAGYQGGEFNPHGGYFVVRQSDAHAWSEVWLAGRGWVRVDPTAAVAPERIERSIDVDELAEGAPVTFVLIDPGPIAALIKQLWWGVDAVNTTWHRWILGYSDKRQVEMLTMLGLDFLKGTSLGVGMVAITALVVVLITLGILRQSRAAHDPVLRLYQTFCRKLARRGLMRRPYEGPRDYASRIMRQRPDLCDSVQRIVRLYIGLRYGRIDSPDNRKQLRKLVRGFHP